MTANVVLFAGPHDGEVFTVELLCVKRQRFEDTDIWFEDLEWPTSIIVGAMEYYRLTQLPNGQHGYKWVDMNETPW